MSRLFGFLTNLRIGTKIALSSAIALLLLVTIVGAQMYGGALSKEATDAALMRTEASYEASEARSSMRGMQVGLRDISRAESFEDMKRADAVIVDHYGAAVGYIKQAAKRTDAPEQSQRLNAIKKLIEELYSKKPEVLSLQTQLLNLRQRFPEADVSGHKVRIATMLDETMLPIVASAEALATGYLDTAAELTKRSVRDAEQWTTTVRDVGIAMGCMAVIILLGSVVFSIATITRPMQALTGGMLELAGGNFDVVLPGLERKDEVGAVAQAVETFKVKLAEKAQIEAAEKADRDLKEAAARAERERLAAEEKLAADRRAEEERAAATAKVMSEFDAAVGGIAKAAMAGDFSQRVSLEGKEGVIRNLAAAMNTMCDNIGRVMDEMAAMMGSLADGDLTRRIHADYDGAFATLKDSANATAERLSETLADITASAREVANAATEIATATTDLSQRTEEQAASLEETSAAMEQMASTVKNNAENAQKANSLTASASEVANRGGSVVASTVDAMSRIEQSSKRIADIIGVIDEIARQTNLLALNAAVEAARAGDAGRGFAVVATEVRSLAQRSSQAAKDIKDLITNSSSQVTEGVDLVNRTGQSLNEIVSSIKAVAEIVGDIATASQEQATGIEQVNRALSQMDEATQQNSALVEENAATAKTLETQSAAMTERVSFFRLDSTAAAGRVTPMKAPERAVPAARRGGPVGRMQANLATAMKAEDWEEF
jgi:methyl-accepting chemotaxis protein